jgi:hypothetical protein
MEIDLMQVIGKPEGTTLEYKAVLPPARTLGQIIASFANAEGGNIILGVRELNGNISITGLSEDFHAQAILSKALELLSPTPITEHKYAQHAGKKLFVISVQPAEEVILIEGKKYIRQGDQNVLSNPATSNFTVNTYSKISELEEALKVYQIGGTGAISKFVDHYVSILNIIADLPVLLYPISPGLKTENNEGKVLFRILFSSCADNFETYLSDLLYEIFLANPDTLKSGQQITVKEVLDCSDIQEFINYYAKKKLSKLQRGSVRGFITDNQQISCLNAISEEQQNELEKLLQVRHLYAHKNGVVDEKFLSFFPEQFNLNETHEMTLDEFLDCIKYLAETVSRVDVAAIVVHDLASV